MADAVVYAVIGPQMYYRLQSVPEAVDIVLKACFVLDLQFCAAARSSWTFVQRTIYGIKSKHDVVSTKLQELQTCIAD
jgi:hypothetical protein